MEMFISLYTPIKQWYRPLPGNAGDCRNPGAAEVEELICQPTTD